MWGVTPNDADIGKDRAGLGDVVALDKIGMAAATVSGASCRIGDGADTAERGVVSFANRVATGLAVVPVQSARDATRLLEDAAMPDALLPALSERLSDQRIEGLKARLVNASIGQPWSIPRPAAVRCAVSRWYAPVGGLAWVWWQARSRCPGRGPLLRRGSAIRQPRQAHGGGHR